jgi:hypothetical protein
MRRPSLQGRIHGVSVEDEPPGDPEAVASPALYGVSVEDEPPGDPEAVASPKLLLLVAQLAP